MPNPLPNSVMLLDELEKLFNMQIIDELSLRRLKDRVSRQTLKDDSYYCLEMVIACLYYDLESLEKSYNKISNKTSFFSNYVACRQRIGAVNEDIIQYFIKYIEKAMCNRLDILNVIHASYVFGMYDSLPELFQILGRVNLSDKKSEEQNYKDVDCVLKRNPINKEIIRSSNIEAMNLVAKNRFHIAGYFVMVPSEYDGIHKTLMIRGTPEQVYQLEDSWIVTHGNRSGSIESIFFEPWPMRESC
ncbi:hypothetical protein SIID45300_02183 [Candidatus Magnetaquicoccaceae bacterium FCR-1]|uniref:Uncharacterized protein n=1 Tax=Candidatus Magnetaquiglobus chichijimensis TaxID=3141448 RepID=A0ABQ0CAD0_9PROT